MRLDPAQVAFDRSRDPDTPGRPLSSRRSARDVREIEDGLAAMLNRSLAGELRRGGYGIVTEDAADVLHVTPSIVDLYVDAPDTKSPGMSRTYSMEAGRMTLVAEARDSVTGQLLARVVDTKQGTDTGRLQWANGVTNGAEARRALSRWARALRTGLDAVTGKAQ